MNKRLVFAVGLGAAILLVAIGGVWMFSLLILKPVTRCKPHAYRETKEVG